MLDVYDSDFLCTVSLCWYTIISIFEIGKHSEDSSTSVKLRTGRRQVSVQPRMIRGLSSLLTSLSTSNHSAGNMPPPCSSVCIVQSSLLLNFYSWHLRVRRSYAHCICFHSFVLVDSFIQLFTIELMYLRGRQYGDWTQSLLHAKWKLYH
jgi:hypothetical protein